MTDIIENIKKDLRSRLKYYHTLHVIGVKKRKSMINLEFKNLITEIKHTESFPCLMSNKIRKISYGADLCLALKYLDDARASRQISACNLKELAENYTLSELRNSIKGLGSVRTAAIYRALESVGHTIKL